MGAYSEILRHTPDHEDLITSTDSEVLCRLVVRWVGQGVVTYMWTPSSLLQLLGKDLPVRVFHIIILSSLLDSVLSPRLENNLYFYWFVDSVESINYTAWTEVRLFVRLRGQSGGTLTYF